MSFLRDAYQPRDGIGELAAKYPDFLKSIADRHLVTPMTIGGLIEKTGQQLRNPVVNGLFRCGEVVNIVASTKVGKSWGIYGLALSIITGAILAWSIPV
jgi:hypothetical protein